MSEKIIQLNLQIKVKQKMRKVKQRKMGMTKLATAGVKFCADHGTPVEVN